MVRRVKRIPCVNSCLTVGRGELPRLVRNGPVAGRECLGVGLFEKAVPFTNKRSRAPIIRFASQTLVPTVSLLSRADSYADAWIYSRCQLYSSVRPAMLQYSDSAGGSTGVYHALFDFCSCSPRGRCRRNAIRCEVQGWLLPSVPWVRHAIPNRVQTWYVHRVRFLLHEAQLVVHHKARVLQTCVAVCYASLPTRHRVIGSP